MEAETGWGAGATRGPAGPGEEGGTREGVGQRGGLG
jgi:hypothetical protein